VISWVLIEEKIEGAIGKASREHAGRGVGEKKSYEE
jgi:hypothetical protein